MISGDQNLVSFNRTSFQQQLKHFSAALVYRCLVGFNRTSFQQQLKLVSPMIRGRPVPASIVHPFNNNWNKNNVRWYLNGLLLQSYILSTTTETGVKEFDLVSLEASIVHPFNNNWNRKIARLVWEKLLQSYILSTTTETCFGLDFHPYLRGLQSYILSTTTETTRPFLFSCSALCFNRTSFQQQLKQMTLQHACAIARLQSYILSTTTET